jgi:hypothetical protein
MDSRSERRAALKATHPDLGGDVDDFIAVMQAFDRAPSAPMTTAAPARGSGAAVRGPVGPRPTITTTPRSRAARSVRRARRRLRTYTETYAPGRFGGPRYAHLLEERP